MEEPNEKQLADHENDLVLSEGKAMQRESAPEDTRFAVLAPYWINGLHNVEGIALADEINQTIKKNRLEEDRDAVAALLAAYPNAKRFGLDVVPESHYLSEPNRRVNMAQPRFLLDGAFVRDKDGSYRPAAGGRAVLEDKGDSLVLKSRSPNGYRAAMELAIAKGWTAIELKGKPAMLADAWLEAKLKGLDVVNYSPTKEDLAKFSTRMAEEKARSEMLVSQSGELQQRPLEVVEPEQPAVVPERMDEQGLEQVAVRPFVDAYGVNKVAQVIYTVSHEGGLGTSHDNPADAAKAFADVPAANLPIVIRSVTRVDGYVEPDVAIAGSGMAPGSDMMVKSVDEMLDHEFAEAYAVLIEHEKSQETLPPTIPGVIDGKKYYGKIVAIEGGQVVQKTGRAPDEVTRHEISQLSSVPEVDDVVDIIYREGQGHVKGKGLELGDDQGIELRR